MKTNIQNLVLCIMVCASGIMIAQVPAGLPDNAEPGNCWVKCVTPNEFKEVTETLVLRPEHKTLSIKPAEYKTVTETVVVKEPTVRYDFIPAVYETVEVPYVKKERRTDLTPVSATFTDAKETIQVYPEVARFEYTNMPNCTSQNPEDCKALCWKEYAAKWETVAVKRLANNAATQNVPVNENTATYTKRVIKEPARYEKIEVPAETATITRQVLVSAAQIVENVVPQETTTITKTILVEKGGITTWEAIECSLLEPTILPIFYSYNSAALRPEAKVVIDTTVLALLKEEPNIRVQIGSHTDARGSDAYNKDLSQRRAQSVVDYLVSRGISSNRLVSMGYGETRLQNDCSNGIQCTDIVHEENRRTDFIVLQN